MSVATEHIYTLADLKDWPPAKAGLPPGGTALAVIGHPIAHSLSPVMHNAALAELARREKDYLTWKYFRFDVPPEQLPLALVRLHAAGFIGLNLTVPHKILAMDLVKEIDPDARRIGAMNTLRRTATGWHGYNTDGLGLSAALKVDLGVQLKGADVVLLGAGGAGRAAAMQCVLEQCASLWIGNRTYELRENLAADLNRAYPSPTNNIQCFSLKTLRLGREIPGKSIVINATPLGLKVEDASPLDLEKISRPEKVYDMIYNPPQTALLRQAAALGLKHANGLSMLVHQGARSLEIWTGQSAPVNTMESAAQHALATH